MASSDDEVQKMMESITKIRNDVESRLNTAMDMMERNLELDLKQKQLLKEQKTKLAVTEKQLTENIELQFVKLESRLHKMMMDMTERHLLDLDKKLVAKEELLRDEIKQQFQKEFEEYKRKSEENYQQLLKKQKEEYKTKREIKGFRFVNTPTTTTSSDISFKTNIFSYSSGGSKLAHTPVSGSVKSPTTSRSVRDFSFGKPIDTPSEGSKLANNPGFSFGNTPTTTISSGDFSFKTNIFGKPIDTSTGGSKPADSPVSGSDKSPTTNKSVGDFFLGTNVPVRKFYKRRPVGSNLAYSSLSGSVKSPTTSRSVRDFSFGKPIDTPSGGSKPANNPGFSFGNTPTTTISSGDFSFKTNIFGKPIDTSTGGSKPADSPGIRK